MHPDRETTGLVWAQTPRERLVLGSRLLQPPPDPWADGWVDDMFNLPFPFSISDAGIICFGENMSLLMSRKQF